MHFPALQLIWSPTGAGAVVQGHSLPVGGVEPVPEMGLTFGFEGNVRLRYPPPHEAREICRIEKRAGGLRLLHYHPTKHHCAVNGRAVEERELQLEHRDVVSFTKGPIFRVLEAQLVEARSPSLEAAIRAAPRDEELLRVYADFLLDQGDPLGERLARARSGADDDDARWLGVLALLYEAGRLNVEWRHGLAVKAVLRNPLGVFASLEQALTHLVALPVMRFLRELTLDVSSDRLSIADGLQALSAVKLPDTVTLVSLGDVPVAQREAVELLLARSERKAHVGYFRDAVLSILKAENQDVLKAGDQVSVTSRRVELGRTEAVSQLFGTYVIGSHVIGADGARFLVASLGDAPPPLVNGRPVDKYPLRDGDVLEIGTDLVARFTLVR